MLGYASVKPLARPISMKKVRKVWAAIAHWPSVTKPEPITKIPKSANRPLRVASPLPSLPSPHLVFCYSQNPSSGTCSAVATAPVVPRAGTALAAGFSAVLPAGPLAAVAA